MKKLLKTTKNTTLALLLSTSLAYANSSYIAYQGVAFDNGTAVASSSISLRYTILELDNTTIVYQETINDVSTSAKGFFSHKIGSGTRTAGAATYDDIVWADGYQLKVEVDYNNGSSWSDLGVQKFTSNVYAIKSTMANALTTPRDIGGVSFDGSADIDLPGVNTAGNQDTSGNAATATTLQTARTIGGVSFDGSTNIDLPGVNTTGNQDTSGNAASATQLNVSTTVSNSDGSLLFMLGNTTGNNPIFIDSGITYNRNSGEGILTVAQVNGLATMASKLQFARNIGGVSFDGSANINLPGVNTAGTQDTSGNAATATKLATARTIGGVSFDGSANINLPGVNQTGTQNTSGNAATATALAANGSNCPAGQFPLGVDASGAVENCTVPSYTTDTKNTINNTLTSDSTVESLSAAQGKELKTLIDTKLDSSGTASKASELSSDPSACTAGQFVTDMDADGTLTCDTPSSSDVINNLTSDSTTDALSAKQGKELKTLVDGKAASAHTHSYLSTGGGTLTGTLNITGTTTKDLTTYSTSNVSGIYSYDKETTVGVQSGGNVIDDYGAGQGIDSVYVSLDATYAVVSPAFFAPSDKRIKDDITPLNNSLEIINKLNPVNYTKIDKVAYGNRVETGFIAQEVKEVLPSAVNTGNGFTPVLKTLSEFTFEDGVKYKIQVTKEGENTKQEYIGGEELPEGEIYIISKEVDDFHSIEYDVLYTHAIKAIQEQQVQIQTQQNEIDTLKNELLQIKDLLRKNGMNIQ